MNARPSQCERAVSQKVRALGKSTGFVALFRAILRPIQAAVQWEQGKFPSGYNCFCSLSNSEENFKDLMTELETKLQISVA